MSTGHQSRKRRRAAPLLVAIVDHDTRRFTVEGPVLCDEPWVTEVARARKAGRRISFSLLASDGLDEAVAAFGLGVGYEQWPSMSIVHPAGI